MRGHGGGCGSDRGNRSVYEINGRERLVKRQVSFLKICAMFFGLPIAEDDGMLYTIDQYLGKMYNKNTIYSEKRLTLLF